MENNVTIEKLKQEIEYWKDSFIAMEDLKNCIKFCHSVNTQKIKYIEKHHPDILKKASWDLNTAQKEQHFDLKFLN